MGEKYKGGSKNGNSLSEEVFDLLDAEEVSARSTRGILNVRCQLDFQMNTSNRQLNI